MSRITWTGKARLTTTDASFGLVLQSFIPRDLVELALRISEKADRVNAGFFTFTLENVKRPRTTGPDSQNNRANGFIRQIAMATGNSFELVEASCKLQALDEGYPMEKVLGKWVAKSQADLSVEECAAWIGTIERIAAEEGVALQE